jgi:hypothetical protein
MTDTTTTTEATTEDVSTFALNGADVNRADAMTWLGEQATEIREQASSHEAGIITEQLAIGRKIHDVVNGPTVLALVKTDSRKTARSAFLKLIGMPKNTGDKYVKAYESSARLGAAVKGSSVSVLYELRHVADPKAAKSALVKAAKAANGGEATVTTVKDQVRNLPKTKLTDSGRTARTSAETNAVKAAAKAAKVGNPIDETVIEDILAGSVADTITAGPFVKVSSADVDAAAARLTLLAIAMKEGLTG